MIRKAAGFTLVEIVVAGALISLALFFLISILPTANLSLRKAQDEESATLYGQQMVQTALQALPTESPLPTAGPATVTGTTSLNGTDFNVVQTTTPLQSQQNYVLFEVSVTVSRTDKKGLPVQLVTREEVSVPSSTPCPACKP